MDALLDELRLLIKARYPYIYLVSYEEERVERALRWLIGNQENRLIVWSSTRGFEGVPDPQGISLDPFRALELVRTMEPRKLILFKDLHPYLQDPRVIRALRDLEPRLEEDQKTVIFLAPSVTLPRELEKDIVVRDVPLPSAQDVSKLLATLVKAQNLQITPELFERMVKASLGLTEKELKKVYSKLLIATPEFEESSIDVLHTEKRKILRRSQFLEYVEQQEDMGEVGGLGQLKEWLVQRGQAFTERARQYGLPQPKGLFMLGVQGCGKSLTAKAVSRMWHLPLLRLDLASMFTGGKGGTEDNLRDTIRIAESMAPVVLWIDEIEKAFGGLAGNGPDRGAEARVFGALLTWLQEKSKPVFVIATANDIQTLPPELLRKGRFDEIFFIDLPNVHDRAEILSIHLRKRGREPDLFQLYSVAEATEKYSGAELEQLVIASFFHAFSRSREVLTEDLLRMARDSVPLAVTMHERIKLLKEWAQDRTRPAAFDTRRVDFFEEWEEVN